MSSTLASVPNGDFATSFSFMSGCRVSTNRVPVTIPIDRVLTRTDHQVLSSHHIDPKKTTGATKPKTPADGRGLCNPCRDSAVTYDPTHHIVEAIGRNSNLGHLCKTWADLRERISNSPPRPASSGTPPRSKRLLGATHVDDIVQKYDSGETTQQIGAYFGISKSRVATVLREQGVTIRRQGLTIDQASEAEKLYADGKSLCRLPG